MKRHLFFSAIVCSSAVAVGSPALLTESGEVIAQSLVQQAKPKKKAVNWIWRPGAPPTTETVYFRHTFELPENDKSASLTMTCDNGFTVWLNGKVVGKGANWQQPETMEVRKDVKKGVNVIAVEATNEGTMGGLAASLSIKLANGGDVHVVTDGSWLASGQPCWLQV